MSGSRKGERRGGRKPGTPNRRTAEAVAKAEASGLMPLDYMLSVLRDESQPQEARFAAAEKAAPYLHPRLASVEMAGKNGGPIVHQIERFIVRPAAPDG